MNHLTSLRVYVWKADALQDARRRLTSGDAGLKPAAEKLRLEAEEALDYSPVSVMDKKIIPASGDKHDYMSLASYHWPNPDTPNGLPYIRRDGVYNPEGNDMDNHRLRKVYKTVETLALAWYLFGNERYARHAARLLRTWFLEKDTRMNPHLEYAQAIRGVCDGRGAGIIDSSGVSARLVDALGLLQTSSAWADEDMAGLQRWMHAYLTWLRASRHGKEEGRRKNNHGTWYDVQLISLAFFTGQMDVARATAQKARQKRIASQIEPDGSQPRELRRTRAKIYCLMNLKGLLDLASLAEHAGVNLWTFETPNGRSLRKALDWLLPYAAGEKNWQWGQTGRFDREGYISLFRRGAVRYQDEGYEEVLEKLPQEVVAAHRINLTFPSFRRQ